MIRNANWVETDIHQQEFPEQERYLFDLVANRGDIHKFITGNIPAHWHNELEIFMLMEGSVRIGIGDTFYDVHAGEGCFINTGILHSFIGLVPSPCLYRSFVFDPSIISGAPGSVFDIRYIRPLMEKGAAFIKIPGDIVPGSCDKHFFQAFDNAFSACADELPGYEFPLRNTSDHSGKEPRPFCPTASRNPGTTPEANAGMDRSASGKKYLRKRYCGSCQHLCQRMPAYFSKISEHHTYGICTPETPSSGRQAAYSHGHTSDGHCVKLRFRKPLLLYPAFPAPYRNYPYTVPGKHP